MEEEFKEGKDVMSQSMMRDNDNGSDRSMEIEAPRDYNDDSFGVSEYSHLHPNDMDFYYFYLEKCVLCKTQIRGLIYVY